MFPEFRFNRNIVRVAKQSLGRGLDGLMLDRAAPRNGGARPSPFAPPERELKLNPLLRDKPALAIAPSQPARSLQRIRLSLLAADLLLISLAGLLLFGGQGQPHPAEIGAAVVALVAAAWLGCLALTLGSRNTVAQTRGMPREKQSRPELAKTLFQ